MPSKRQAPSDSSSESEDQYTPSPRSPRLNSKTTTPRKTASKTETPGKKKMKPAPEKKPAAVKDEDSDDKETTSPEKNGRTGGGTKWSPQTKNTLATMFVDKAIKRVTAEDWKDMSDATGMPISACKDQYKANRKNIRSQMMELFGKFE